MTAQFKQRVRRLAFPFVRTYVRHAPFTAGKVFAWRRIIEPYFFCRSYEFVASTVFGTRISGNVRDLIQAWIYFFGIWEPNLTRWLQRRLAPGDTFIDVGANIGYYSLLASKLVGKSGSVVAIEASPKIFTALQKNLAFNRIQNVRTVNMAVSDHREVLKFYSGPEYNLGSSTTRTEIAERDFEFEANVNAVPLPEILRPQEIRNARVIKIDVEGAELAVASGMAPLLGCCRGDLEIVVEVIPEYLAVEGRSPEDVLKIFVDAGFHAYGLEAEFRPTAYLSGRKEKNPTRIREPLRGDTNVVLSRQDLEVL